MRDGREHEVVDPRRLRHARRRGRRGRAAPGIENPCTSASTSPTDEPAGGERDGEVRRDGGLADAALAAGDRDDARERAGAERHLARRAAAAQALGERAALVGDMTPTSSATSEIPVDGCRGRAHIARDAVRGRASDDRQHDADVRDAAVDARCRGPCRARRWDGAARGRATAPTARRTASARAVGHRVAPSSARSALVVELLEQRSRSSVRSTSRVTTSSETVGERHAQRDDLAGEVLGVGEVALGALAVLLDLHAVAVVLAVLREQDEGRGVRGLQRQDQRQQREVRRARVELQLRAA